MLSLLLLLPALLAPVLAQLALPNPPYLPPNASAGAQVSPPGSPNVQWSNLLGNLLYFYEAQRSGELPATNRVPWRNSSAVEDGQLFGIDLSGGYYDAGDYIKATYTLSFSLMSICWGAIDFGKGYDLANQTAYLDDMVRWGLNWLIKAHPNDTTLYVLVGSTEIDNSYWGGDLTIPSPRPIYQINNTNPGTDAAAQASAAFSACASLYSNRSFDNSSYSAPASLINTSFADTLLQHAHSLYSFAVNATGGHKTYQTSAPETASSYASSGYGDELAIAALFLAHATGNAQYWNDAEGFWNHYSLQEENRVLNWDSKTPALPVLFSQVAKDSSLGIVGNFSKWQLQAEQYFDSIIDNTSPGELTKNGLLYYDGDSDEASLNPALNAAMLFTRYSRLASTPDRRTSYLNFAQSQVDYVLGKNPMSVPYIVGSNPNSPANPHSAMSSGGFDIGNIDNDPVQSAYVIYGAVVGGPSKQDNFFDIRSDWPETEVALDYNAPMLTLAAMHVLSDNSDPYFTALKDGSYAKVKPSGLPCDAAIQTGCPSSGMSKGRKIAIAVVVSVVGLAFAGFLAWYFILMNRTHDLLPMKERD